MLVLGPKLRKTWGERGITLMEIIVVLGVIGVMAAMLAPMVLNYLEDAKKSKAEADVKALAGVIHRLARDVAHFPIYTNGTLTSGAPTIQLLQGPGNDPDKTTSHGQAWNLLTPVGDLENHLIKNLPGGANTPTNEKYRTANSRFLWRGPYMEKISEDAWGNKYLVNIKNADPAENTPANSKVVWVLSAGPNGKIETDPSALADSGALPGGDDIAVRIR